MASFVFIVLVVKFRDSSIHEEYNKFKSYNGVVRILPSPSPVSNETVSNFKAVTVGNTKKSVVRSESYSGNQTLERKLNFTREYLQTVSPDVSVLISSDFFFLIFLRSPCCLAYWHKTMLESQLNSHLYCSIFSFLPLNFVSLKILPTPILLPPIPV